jgi:hypothetical protein
MEARRCARDGGGSDSSDAGVSDRVSVIVGEPGRFLHRFAEPVRSIVQNGPTIEMDCISG